MDSTPLNVKDLVSDDLCAFSSSFDQPALGAKMGTVLLRPLSTPTCHPKTCLFVSPQDRSPSPPARSLLFIGISDGNNTVYVHVAPNERLTSGVAGEVSTLFG